MFGLEEKTKRREDKTHEIHIKLFSSLHPRKHERKGEDYQNEKYTLLLEECRYAVRVINLIHVCQKYLATYLGEVVGT